MEWIKKHYKELILIFLSVAVVLILADWFLHFTGYSIFVSKLLFPRYYFIADKEMGIDIASNFKKEKHTFTDLSYDVWSNELGCFDNPYNNVTPYIYLTGDSFTWGYAPFEEKWGTKIESLINTRVVKCGIVGIGTKQEFIKTSRDINRLPKPELIIVPYNRIDVLDDADFPNHSVYNGYRVANFYKNNSADEARQKYDLWDKYCMFSKPAHPLLQRIKCWFYSRSIIYNLLADNFRPMLTSILPKKILDKAGLIISNPPPAKQTNSYAFHLENIKKFKALADKEKIKLLFVLIPFKEEVRSSGNDQNLQIEKIKPFLESNGISYFDLLPIFRQYDDEKTQSLFWKIDGHWSIKGEHLVGLAVSRYLLEKKFINPPERDKILKNIENQIISEFNLVN